MKTFLIILGISELFELGLMLGYVAVVGADRARRTLFSMRAVLLSGWEAPEPDYDELEREHDAITAAQEIEEAERIEREQEESDERF